MPHNTLPRLLHFQVPSPPAHTPPMCSAPPYSFGSAAPAALLLSAEAETSCSWGGAEQRQLLVLLLLHQMMQQQHQHSHAVPRRSPPCLCVITVAPQGGWSGGRWAWRYGSHCVQQQGEKRVFGRRSSRVRCYYGWCVRFQLADVRVCACCECCAIARTRTHRPCARQRKRFRMGPWSA